MGTSWKAESVTNNFNLYNDMLEHVLGFQTIFQMIKEEPEVHKILDFGCGPGKVSERMALLDDNYSILAVDQSESMIEIAKENRSHKNINYQVIQNEKVDFIQDESIDFAILCFVIINNSSTERIINIIKEIYRVLKKGGSLVILDSHPKAVGIDFTTFTNGKQDKTYVVGENKQQYLKIPGNSDLVLHDWYWDQDSYLRWLSDAGFDSISIKEPTIAELSEKERKGFEQQYKFDKWGNEKENPPFIIFKAIK